MERRKRKERGKDFKPRFARGRNATTFAVEREKNSRLVKPTPLTIERRKIPSSRVTRPGGMWLESRYLAVATDAGWGENQVEAVGA